MALRDLHSNIDTVVSIAPVAVGGGQTGVVVDTRGFDSVEFVFGYGAITATNATITPTVFEGDATGSLTSIADTDLLGTESDAGIGQGTRTNGSTEQVFKRLGYRGDQRYVRADIAATVTTAPPVSAVVVLSHPHRGPVAT